MILLLSYAPWLCWLIPIIGAVLTPLLAKINHKLRDYAAVSFTFLAAVMAALMIPSVLEHPEGFDWVVDWIPSLNITAGVLVDPLSVFMANIVAWISFLIMVYSLGYMHGDQSLTRYWFFMNFFIGNMLLLVLSDNLLQMFFGWEGVGLCSYALIGFWYSDEPKYWVGTPGHKTWGVSMAYPPSHCGMKAFITTRVGDVFLLIAVLIIYCYTGTFNYLQLAKNLGWVGELAKVGLLVPVALLFLGGPVGKSAQFPLIEWLPDAMAGPTSVSALIHAATMVKAGVYLVARVAPIFFVAMQAHHELLLFFEAVAWIGVLTAFITATQALVSKEVKKVLAYSTVSQIGYMMLGLGVGGLTAEFVAGYMGGLFHLMNHAIFKAALFMAAGAIIHATETRFMNEMGGIRGNMKLTFVAMTVATASLSGIPLLGGFWSKDAILLACFEANQFYLFALAAIVAALTFFYSIRMVGMMFLGKKSEHLVHLEHEGVHVHEVSAVMWFPYMALAMVTLLIGLTGPMVEGALHKFFEPLFPHIEHVAALAAEEAVAVNAELVVLPTSFVMLAIGGLLGYTFYVARKKSPEAVVGKSPILKSVYNFLWNRWYINPLYYRVFIYDVIDFGRWAFKWFEVEIVNKRFNFAIAPLVIKGCKSLLKRFEIAVMDRFNYIVASTATAIYLNIRKIQTGLLSFNMIWVIIGFLLLLTLLVGR